MRLSKNRHRNRHRANAADRTVQTPTMARRPSSDGPAPTQLMSAVRETGGFLTRELPRVSPAAVLPPYPHTPYMPMPDRPGAHLDVTRLLPVVPRQRVAADSTATQVLPLVKAELPPSAQHVDPARWHDRTHVEDNDLEPQTRGRHVLDELKAADAETGMPDLVGHDEPTPAIQGAYGRIVAAMTPPVEGLAGAVRLARLAYKTSRKNRRWFVEEETKLDACRRRIAEFNTDWDRQVRDAEIARHGARAVAAAEELAAAYEGNRRRIAEENARRAANGEKPLDVTATTFTKGMQAKVKDLLVKEALKEPLAGSAVTR